MLRFHEFVLAAALSLFSAGASRAQAGIADFEKTRFYDFLRSDKVQFVSESLGLVGLRNGMAINFVDIASGEVLANVTSPCGSRRDEEGVLLLDSQLYIFCSARFYDVWELSNIRTVPARVERRWVQPTVPARIYGRVVLNQGTRASVYFVPSESFHESGVVEIDLETGKELMRVRDTDIGTDSLSKIMGLVDRFLVVSRFNYVSRRRFITIYDLLKRAVVQEIEDNLYHPMGSLDGVEGAPPDSALVCTADPEGNYGYRWMALPSGKLSAPLGLPCHDLLGSHRGKLYLLDRASVLRVFDTSNGRQTDAQLITGDEWYGAREQLFIKKPGNLVRSLKTGLEFTAPPPPAKSHWVYQAGKALELIVDKVAGTLKVKTRDLLTGHVTQVSSVRWGRKIDTLDIQVFTAGFRGTGLAIVETGIGETAFHWIDLRSMTAQELISSTSLCNLRNFLGQKTTLTHFDHGQYLCAKSDFAAGHKAFEAELHRGKGQPRLAFQARFLTQSPHEFALGDETGRVRVLDETGAERATYMIRSDVTELLALSDQFLVYTSKNQDNNSECCNLPVWAFDRTTGQSHLVSAHSRAGYRDIAFDLDGRYLAIMGGSDIYYDASFLVFDLADGTSKPILQSAPVIGDKACFSDRFSYDPLAQRAVFEGAERLIAQDLKDLWTTEGSQP